MKQEDKELLLRYLSMALPYKVIVQVVKYGKCYDEREKKTTLDCKIVGINRYTLITDKDSVEHTYAKGYVSTPITVPIDDGDIKSLPYLRPLSSMTDEEINEFILISDTILWLGNKRSTYTTCILSLKQIDWLLAHHFDFLDLIPKGLAVEMTKENDSHKQYVVITQTILDYIKKNSRNFENLTPILGEKWIIDGEFTYSGVCGGQPVIEIHKTTGEFMRLPKSLIKIE